MSVVLKNTSTVAVILVFMAASALFAMHYQSAGIQGAEILEPTYGVEDGLFSLQEVLNLLENEKVRLVIICNPNNPLGVLTPIIDVEKIVKKAKEKAQPKPRPKPSTMPLHQTQRQKL